MADFPNSTYTPRTVTNVDGVVYDAGETSRIFAEDINKANDEIVAIENYLDNLSPSSPLRLDFNSGNTYLESGVATPRKQFGFLIIADNTIGTLRYMVASQPHRSPGFGFNNDVIYPYSVLWKGIFTSSSNAITYVGIGSTALFDVDMGAGFRYQAGELRAYVFGQDTNEEPLQKISDALSVTVDTPHEYEIRQISNAVGWEFYIDGVLVYTADITGFSTEFTNYGSDFLTMIKRTVAGGYPSVEAWNVRIALEFSSLWP